MEVCIFGVLTVNLLLSERPSSIRNVLSPDAC